MGKSKSMCVGCRDDFYNGKNTLNVKECWNFKSAKIVSRKKVPYTLCPPWDMKPMKVLSCYHENGFAMVDPKRRC
jgi:hypothetical protein